MGTSLIPNKISQSERSSFTSTPADKYSLSLKQRWEDDCATIFTWPEFLCTHLHWAGVSATLLSAGIFPFPYKSDSCHIALLVSYGRKVAVSPDAKQADLNQGGWHNKCCNFNFLEKSFPYPVTRLLAGVTHKKAFMINRGILRFIPALLAVLLFISCDPKAGVDEPDGPFTLSYGDSIIYMRAQAADYIVEPLQKRAGTYDGFPEGIEIDENTGAINVSKVRPASATASPIPLPMVQLPKPKWFYPVSPLKIISITYQPMTL